jgi:TPP-dependent pyruvate/acetoin dehydrogenase alpha subunit
MRDSNELRDLYRDMYKIRYYNDRMRESYDEGKDIPAGVHGSKGQEAPAVGVCDHLREEDWAFATHRSSHVAIAKGTDLKALIAEQLGREGGVCGGKAGEQHILDEEANFVSGAIVAQHLPSATGVALAHKRRDTDNVSVGFIGDGAANQGAFYECLNFASVNDLPVVFVIEDNDYGISTPKRQVTAVEDNSKRAAGQNMPGKRIEDNDVLTIHETAGEAIERARAGNGPTLLEIETCRLQGHFFDDPVQYRSEDEMEAMRKMDCMPKIEAALDDAGVPASDIAEIERQVEQRVDKAIEYALDQPYPDHDRATATVFSESGNGGGLQ